MITKAELGQVGAILLVLLLGFGVMAMLPDREISDDEYVSLAQAVEACPDAQSALDAANKDGKILNSEANTLESIIKGYVEQDARVTKHHNVSVAKGQIKGPLQKPTCVALPPSVPSITATKPKK